MVVRPRLATSHVFTYSRWDYGKTIVLRGKVDPNPGGGWVGIRFSYTGGPLKWERVMLDSSGEWASEVNPVAGTREVGVSATYEGNMVYGSSGTTEVVLKKEVAR